MAKSQSLGEKTKISVLLPEEDFLVFDEYCEKQGFKKSTLIARLIREHLHREGFQTQRELFQLTGSGQGKD
jgi:hypothetical protein